MSVSMAVRDGVSYVTRKWLAECYDAFVKVISIQSTCYTNVTQPPYRCHYAQHLHPGLLIVAKTSPLGVHQPMMGP